MLGFVAIVAFIATTAAYIPEYSEEFVRNFTNGHPVSEIIAAKVYNAENGMKFRADSFYSKLGLGLVPFQRADRAEAKKEGCGNLFGIHVDNINKDVCKLTFFLLTVLENEKDSVEYEEFIRLSFFFEFEDQSLVIDVPVYKTPSEYASADEGQLRAWASNKKVGVLAPISDLLREIGATNEWKSNFKWFSELVSLGLFKKAPTEITTELYTTYPLVMSDAEINAIFRVVEES